MKIKDLDRNEVYGLEEIKKDAVKFDMLKEWLKENDEGWTDVILKDIINYVALEYAKECEDWQLSNGEPTKCALTLFDIDITDYQVDCSDLSKEQIEELKSIVSERGFDVNKGNYKNVEKNIGYVYFKLDMSSEFYIGENDSSKTTITYDKFMELFGKKPIKQAVEELAEAFCEKKEKHPTTILDYGIIGIDIESDGEDLKVIDFSGDNLEECVKSYIVAKEVIKRVTFHYSDSLYSFDTDSNTAEDIMRDLRKIYLKGSIDSSNNKPSQYQIGIDTFTRAEANMTREEILACVRFNLDKYTWRKKGQDKEDFEKIIAYANWALKNL